MDLVPWQRKHHDSTPGSLIDFRKDMNDLFDGFFKSAIMRKGAGVFSPSIEISEDKKSYTVRIEVPGIEKKDVHVMVGHNFLTVKGQKKEAKEEKNKDSYYQETRYGSFYRQIPLEAGVDPKRIRSEFRNGVLVLHAAKNKNASSKPVTVKIK